MFSIWVPLDGFALLRMLIKFHITFCNVFRETFFAVFNYPKLDRRVIWWWSEELILEGRPLQVSNGTFVSLNEWNLLIESFEIVWSKDRNWTGRRPSYSSKFTIARQTILFISCCRCHIIELSTHSACIFSEQISKLLSLLDWFSGAPTSASNCNRRSMGSTCRTCA